MSDLTSVTPGQKKKGLLIHCPTCILGSDYIIGMYTLGAIKSDLD